MAVATSYLPIIFLPNDSEKYRLLDHYREYGVCPASAYQAMPSQERPPHPQFCALEDRKYPRVKDRYPRLTFIRFLLGRLSAC